MTLKVTYSFQRDKHYSKRKPKRITIDLDPTDDGQQTFAFYNTHYDGWCYLPQTVWITFNDESEQYVVGVLLRPGNAHPAETFVGQIDR